jgi:hypothetical protein
MSFEKKLFELSAKAIYPSFAEEKRNQPSEIEYTVTGSDGVSSDPIVLKSGVKVDLNASLQDVLKTKIGALAENTQSLQASAPSGSNLVSTTRVHSIVELHIGDYVAITTNGQLPAKTEYVSGTFGFYGRVTSVDNAASTFKVKFRDSAFSAYPIKDIPLINDEIEVPVVRDAQLAVWKVPPVSVNTPPPAAYKGSTIAPPNDDFKRIVKTALEALKADTDTTNNTAAVAAGKKDVITLNKDDGMKIGLSESQIKEINRQLALLGVKEGGDILGPKILENIKSLNDIEPEGDANAGKITAQKSGSKQYEENTTIVGALTDKDWIGSVVIGSITEDKIKVGGSNDKKIHIVVIPPGNLVGSYITDGRSGQNYLIDNVDVNGKLEFKSEKPLTKGGKRKSHKRRKNRRRGTRKQ